MKNPLKPISISLSPNTQADDVKLAFSLLFQPRKWQQNSVGAKLSQRESLAPTRRLKQEFAEYLGVKHAYAFNSGRSSLMAILKALELEKGSEVLLQAFTCNAAVNPIRWAGFEPVFVDCDENYNLSAADLERKITPKSRIVMVQHTFGLPADIDKIAAICQKHNLILIEDCAHSLGAEYRGRKVGTFGKAAFFSFSRDKIISCVYGGMAVTDDDKLAKRMAAFQEKIGYPSNGWTRQQLLHPALMNWLILPMYSIVGKYKLVVLQWLNILSKAIHWKEKRGMKPDYFPKRLPDALAILALNQFKKLDAFNEHRRKIAQIYFDELKSSGFVLPPNPGGVEQIFLRFSIRYDEAAKIIKKAWSKNLLLGDWYRAPVDPFDTKPETIGYKKGSCPRAEEYAGKIINLPTHINITDYDAKKIVQFLINFDD